RDHVLGVTGVSRLLCILAVCALSLSANRASADAEKPNQLTSIDVGARQRCTCTSRPASRTVTYKRYRTGSAYASLGYEPLPYRCGYFPEPYRYRRHVAVLIARPAGYHRHGY